MTEQSLGWADLGLGNLDLSQVEEAEGFVDVVGEGVFECITEQLFLGRHEKSGAVYARLDYEVANGEKAGKKFQEMFWNLGDPDAMSRRFLKTRLLSLGLPGDFQGLPDPAAFENIPVIVTRKKSVVTKDGTKREYFNVVDVKLAGSASAQKQQQQSEPATVNESSDPLGSFFN